MAGAPQDLPEAPANPPYVVLAANRVVLATRTNSLEASSSIALTWLGASGPVAESDIFVFVSKVPLQRERSERPVGRLDEGTPIYAPIGEMLQDGDRVRCHLCGRWLRMVAGQHLIAAHGMTTDEYRELFHLDVTRSTACTETSELKPLRCSSRSPKQARDASTRSGGEARRQLSRGGGRWRSAAPI
jgi:predicted transcriptional regulator